MENFEYISQKMSTQKINGVLPSSVVWKEVVPLLGCVLLSWGSSGLYLSRQKEEADGRQEEKNEYADT